MPIGEYLTDEENKMKKHCMIRFSPVYNWKYNLTHPWVYPICFYDEIRGFIQRGLYGYAGNDRVDLDNYLCLWLPAALREMKGVGYPWRLTAKKWENILENIAVGFECSNKLSNLHYDYTNKKETRELNRKARRGLGLFVEYFHHLWM